MGGVEPPIPPFWLRHWPVHALQSFVGDSAAWVPLNHNLAPVGPQSNDSLAVGHNNNIFWAVDLLGDIWRINLFKTVVPS